MATRTQLNLLLYFVIGVFSCNSGVDIDEISYQIDAKNVLKINVNYESDSKTSFVEYWAVNDTIKRKSAYSNSDNQHAISLIALLPETQYNFQIMCQDSDDETWVTSDILEIKTGVLPDSLPEFTLVHNKGEVFDGYVLVRAVHKPGSMILLDNKANIVWYSVADTLLMNPFSLTNDKNIISLYSTNTIREQDLYGNIKFELKKGKKGLDKLLHHEIRRVQNDNILALTREEKMFDLSSKGGLLQDTVKADGIILLDSVGNKIWDWNIFDVADPLLYPEIMKYKSDWGHANSVNVLSDGNYIISFLLFSQVWKVNSKTGELMWKLGGEGDFDLEEEFLFFKQHAAHETLDGDILIFDNGTFTRQSSRAIKFNINDDKMIARSTMSTFLPDSLYSFKQGNVYQLGNGNLLFDVAMKNKIAITSSEGEVLWQVNSSVSHYRAYYLDDI